jgi:hypothetical protein
VKTIFVFNCRAPFSLTTSKASLGLKELKLQGEVSRFFFPGCSFL